MDRCFVIQPFDGGMFDKRYTDVFDPAIRAAGLEPYRVDQDPAVDVPIDAIEKEIRNSAVCLADITKDNPNVWYELGFAFASKKQVVMLCGSERQGESFPFDIQHRTIVKYSSESSSDFRKLSEAITDRLSASLKRAGAMRQVAESDQLAPVLGLSQVELIVLASIAGLSDSWQGNVSTYQLKRNVENSGFTSVAYSLGAYRLEKRGLAKVTTARDYNGEEYEALELTPEGWEWIDSNEQLFALKRPPQEDDLPF